MTHLTLRQHLSKLGKKGAAATNKKLTAEERKEAARKAAKARWAKTKKKGVSE